MNPIENGTTDGTNLIETSSQNANTESKSESRPGAQAESTGESLYTDLHDCLENLVRVYRSLLEVVRREKEILVASRLDELNENNKSKDTLLIRIRSLENQRIKCATDLAKHVGADTDQPRLLDIANHCDPKWADPLRNMHSVLELLIKRVADVNKQNEELVQAALNNITGAMEAIRDGLKPKAGYGRQGASSSTTVEGGQLVRREV